MRIGILQTGTSPEELKPRHGDYDDLFRRMLGGRGFSLTTYPVLDGVLPDDVHDADGWLITGSRFGVYEEHDWIPPLEAFIRDAFAAAVPIVGICFGHQILAQALGGTVKKFDGGWSVGAATYESENGAQETMLAWHQDQVTRIPAEAKVIGSSDFCANAILAYGNKALTVQPHPEFTPEFLTDLLAARRAILPDHIADQAVARMNEPLTSGDFANRIEAFFKAER